MHTIQTALRRNLLPFRSLSGATWLLAMAATLAAAGPSTSPTDQYLQARDAYLAKFKGAPPCSACVDSALADLEGRIRPLIGEVSIPGFAGPGRINLLTLVDEVGVDRLDGLRFEDSGRTLIVTTPNLVQSYAARHRDLPKDLRKIPQANAFYARALTEAAGFANFVRIQDPKVPGIESALGSVGAFAQDFAGVLPDQVVVFAVRGRRVYLVRIPANPVPAAIPQCEEIWQGQTKGKSEAKLLLRRYQDCVRDRIQTPANLAAWKAQVQGILETLAKAP